jgi:hypothetical protein
MEHDTLFDELDRARFVRSLAVATFAGAALLLGAAKVRNEFKMTEMYERQAIALERIADAQDRQSLSLGSIGWDIRASLGKQLGRVGKVAPKLAPLPMTIKAACATLNKTDGFIPEACK